MVVESVESVKRSVESVKRTFKESFCPEVREGASAKERLDAIKARQSVERGLMVQLRKEAAEERARPKTKPKAKTMPKIAFPIVLTAPPPHPMELDEEVNKTGLKEGVPSSSAASSAVGPNRSLGSVAGSPSSHAGSTQPSPRTQPCPRQTPRTQP